MLSSHPGSADLASSRTARRRRLRRGVLGISTLLHVSLAGLLIGIVASVIVWGLSETAPPAQSAEPEQYVVVTVQPGDTLWSIARRVSEGKADLRVLTHRIQKLNALDSAMLLPGQSLTVPLHL
ncbi:MAG: LysM peptidoglycan-binding domain-containing protein [Firmicutes bacterium]|nr:LysM peptidoglycan-binding domain-containing protein [Bacillota bacterium]